MTTVELVTAVEVLIVCVEVKVLLVFTEVVKSSLTLAPFSVTVLVTGLNSGFEAVTVIVPDAPIGMA